MRTSEIASLVGGVLVGDADRAIEGVARIEEATSEDLSFVANPRYARFAESVRAGALIVDDDFPITRTDVVYIRVADPYRAFLKVVAHLIPRPPRPRPGIHPSAVVADDVLLGDSVSIGPHVVIGERSRIGPRSVIHAGATVGADVSIGADTTIHSNVSIYGGTQIGDRVIVHAGAVLGADGFGFLPESGGSWEKIPQVGIVVVGSDVEIGANSTIDRAMIGATVIQQGVKLDNLVHVAHNVTVGRNTAIAAQTGVAGSTKIGEGNMIAGQVGIVGHIETAAGVIIEPQAGVSKSLRKAGRYFGHPAKEHSQALRQEGALRQLPDLLQTIRRLRERVEQLESTLGIPRTDESP